MTGLARSRSLARHIRYIESFFKRRCMRDILDLKVFPDVKEMTEAEAMRRALVKRIRMKEISSSNLVIVVGDGSTPRLGVLLAYTTSWTIISIDPNLRNLENYKNCNRLICIDRQIEDGDIHRLNSK